eukprot:gb/GECG01008099.1/.p1 GENE.gb/GECG01008099.1/~~gb/GECG01008099.1/.p1  ORF type:complete len:298 (+),score=42.39 gb/GECG01008099.1/:1-894(+)
MSEIEEGGRRQSVKELRNMYASGSKNDAGTPVNSGLKPKNSPQGRQSMPPHSHTTSTNGQSSMTDSNIIHKNCHSHGTYSTGASNSLSVQDILDEINSRRERSGLKPLRVREELIQSASTIAQENVEEKIEVSDFGQLVKNAGYEFRSIAQKGLSTSSRDTKQVVDSLLNGSNDVVSDKFTEAGIAIATEGGDSAPLRFHIIGHFARPQPNISPPSKELEAEIDKLRQSLDTMSPEIDDLHKFLRVHPPDDIDEYNRLVNKTNDKIHEFQEVQEKYNEKVREHRRQVREYNHQISEC